MTLAASNSAPHAPWSQVILSGYNGDHPPPDQEGFLEFARSLQAPDVYNKLKEATPLTPVMCCESPARSLQLTSNDLELWLLLRRIHSAGFI
jgi:hypothetical protein